MSEPDDVKSERRLRVRVPAYVAVELSTPAKPGRCGVTRNASGTGLLIVTPSRFREGDEMDVRVHVGGLEAHATGRVVRVDENPRSSSEVFRYRLAVALAEPLPAAVLERVEASAA